MKRIILVIALIFSTALFSSAQEMSIESFNRLDNDLDARVTAPKTDQNGDVCAIIKVVTTQTGFTFNVGLMGIIATVQKPGEIWVYVPQKVNRITISHPQLGVLRDQYFPISIDAATCYELRLIAGTVTQIVEQDAGGQYFAVNYTPENVSINLYIDDEFKAIGTEGYVSTMLPYGKHTYRLEAIGYNNSAGSMTIGKEKTEISVDMVSSVGYINIEADSSVEDDVDIYIDGELVGKAPLKSAALSAGEHTVQALSKYYIPFQSIVNVPDGNEVVMVVVELEPNFARYLITNPDSDAKIYVNEKYVGSGSVEVRLSNGMNLIELRKESHRTVSKTVDAVVGAEQTIELTAPQPIYGTLQVESTPQGAEIYLDGENVGKTPLIVKNTLIGSHEVTLKRTGYQDYTTEVLIEQSKITTRSIEMLERITTKLTVTSTPSGASVLLNDKYVGVTPFVDKELDTGSYTLEVRMEGYESYSSTFEAIKGHPVTKKAALTKIITPAEQTTTTSHIEPSNTTPQKKKGIGNMIFLHLTMGIPSSDEVPNLDLGGMFGCAKRAGWYVSYSSGLLSNSSTEEDYYSKRWMMNAGALLRPASWLVLYGGVGYGSYKEYYLDRSSFNYYSDSYAELSYEAGVMVVLGKAITLSCGYGAIGNKYNAMSVGIGFAF